MTVKWRPGNYMRVDPVAQAKTMEKIRRETRWLRVEGACDDFSEGFAEIDKVIGEIGKASAGPGEGHE